MATGMCLGKEDGLVALGGAGSMAEGSLWGSEGQGWGVLATLQRSRGRVSFHTPSLPPSTTATASRCSGCPTCPRGAHLSWLPCGPGPPVGLSLLGCSDDATLCSLLASPQQSVAYGRTRRNRRLREVRGAPGLTQLPRESDVRWHQNSGLLPSHVHGLSLHQSSQHGGSRVLVSLERATVLVEAHGGCGRWVSCPQRQLNHALQETHGGQSFSGKATSSLGQPLLHRDGPCGARTPKEGAECMALLCIRTGRKDWAGPLGADSVAIPQGPNTSSAV